MKHETGWIALACAVMVAGCGGGDGNSTVGGGNGNGGNGSGTGCAALNAGAYFVGMTSAGEVVRLMLDQATQRYELAFVRSPIQRVLNNPLTTREGLVVTGALTHPQGANEACTFALGSAQTADGSYAVAVNDANPPIVRVAASGMVTGGSLGATMSFDGVFPPLGLAKFAKKTFDFYNFIGFRSLETDIAKAAGTYNAQTYRARWTDNYPQAIKSEVETLAVDGTCTVGNQGQCVTIKSGKAWKNLGDGLFISGDVDAPTSMPSLYNLAGASSAARGYLIVGNVNGVRIPVAVRRGAFAQWYADEESGISVLTPAAVSTLAGDYRGVDTVPSAIAVTFGNQSARFTDADHAASIGTLQLTEAAATPGLLDINNGAGFSGKLSAAAGLFALTATDKDKTSVFAIGAN